MSEIHKLTFEDNGLIQTLKDGAGASFIRIPEGIPSPVVVDGERLTYAIRKRHILCPPDSHNREPWCNFLPPHCTECWLAYLTGEGESDGQEDGNPYQ